MFGKNVFVNKLPKNNKVTAIHIYTRPFDLYSVKPRNSLKIYTTPVLKLAMNYKDGSDLKSTVISVADGDITFSIEVPNCQTLRVRFFHYNTNTLDALALFEYDDKITLYAERYVGYGEILKIQPIWQLIQDSKIDQLCIDTSAIDVKKFNLKSTACDEIKNQLDRYQDYQMFLVLDDYGYEDLVAELAAGKFECQIFLDDKRRKIFDKIENSPKFCEFPNEARIIVLDRMPSRGMQFRSLTVRFRKRLLEKQITKKPNQHDMEDLNETIALLDAPVDGFDDDAIPKSGIFEIQYTSCPTFNEIQFLVELIGPRKICQINSKDGEIPPDILDYCR